MANVSSSNGLEKRPKLRFPGFDEPWRAAQLGNLLIELSDYATQESGFPLLTSSRQGLFVQEDYFIDKQANAETTVFSVLPYGCITYRHMSDDNIFHFNINRLVANGLVSKEYPVFTVRKEVLDTDFLVDTLNSSPLFSVFCIQQKKGGTRTRLYFKTLCSYQMFLPVLHEQQVIASFIRLLDKRIERQMELVETLKKYKRGLSSSLFDEISKSGCPAVSFADGFRLLQNNTFSRDDLSYYVGDVRNIHYGDVLIKYGTVTDIGALSVPCIKPDRDIEKFSSSSYLRNGDIVFADTAEDYTVGKATEIVGVTNQRVLSGLHTIPCRPHDRFAPMFLGHYFNSYHFRRQIYRMIQGIKVSSISKSEIAKTTILTPPYDVQRKVASVLSEVDHLIEKEAETVIVLQKIRRGLLQQLFI